MSNHCRRLRTAISVPDAKSLIYWRCVPVAEVRQASAMLAKANNLAVRPGHHYASGCCEHDTTDGPGREDGPNALVVTCRSSCIGERCSANATRIHHDPRILHCVLSLIFHITSVLKRLLYCAGFSSAIGCKRIASARGNRRLATRPGLQILQRFQRFVMVLTVSSPIRGQHNPLIEWWVSARIRGRRYEQAIAAIHGWFPPGSIAGGADFRGSGTHSL